MRQVLPQVAALLPLGLLVLLPLAACEAPSPPPGFGTARDGGARSPSDQGEPGSGGEPGDGRPGPIGNGKAEDGPRAPGPKVTAIAPPNALLGAPTTTLVVTGSGFVPRSFVEIEFVPLATTFVSERELRATLPDDVLARTGARRITVSTAPPGGGTSAATAFEVQNPTPKLLTLAPTNVLVNAAATRLTISGSGFVAGAKLTFGGAELQTTVQDGKTIVATLPANQLAQSGTVPLTVVNPAPGGGASTPLSFTVANPNVVISSVDPVSAVLGTAGVTLNVTGSGFVAASRVSFNGNPVPTTFAGATRLTAQVPATALAATGNFSIVVTNPAPGGGVSVPASFQVANPAPVATSVAPARATAGDGPTPIAVTGRGFTRDSEIRLAGARAATQYVSATELRATIPAAQLATSGALAIDVVTPAPGGGTSDDVTFVVENPAPTVTGTSPTTLVAGGAEARLSVQGSNFVSASTVLVAGSAVATEYVSATQLRATIPAASIASPGTLTIAARNPAPGGGTSSPYTLTVSAPSSGTTCDTAGVDVVLTETGAPKSFALTYDKGPAPRFIYSSTDEAPSTCPVAELSSATQSYAGVMVQNATDKIMYLSTWAACGASNEDAFMSVYELASGLPSTDDARKKCTGRVSNGQSAAGHFASPESAGSIGCPGLTKANGGAILLLPCEKAAVLVQPFSYPTWGRPATLKAQLED